MVNVRQKKITLEVIKSMSREDLEKILLGHMVMLGELAHKLNTIGGMLTVDSVCWESAQECDEISRLTSDLHQKVERIYLEMN